jgi:hypothetical protein
MPEKRKDVSETPGLGWRVSLSIVAGIGWLIFLIMWFFFYALGFTLYQNIAVLIVSMVAVAVIEGLTWVPMWWQPDTPGFKRLVSLNIVLGALIAVFVFIWLFFYAEGFTLYMNIAFIVIPLTFWGVLQSVTRRRWMKEKPWLSTARYAVSQLVSIAWGAFLFVWFYYYAQTYTFTENVLVFFVSAIIMGTMQGLIRAPWKSGTAEPGLGWRVALSAIMGVGWILFVVFWLLLYAPGFSFLQNLAIIIVSLLIMAAVLGAAWAPWAIKHGARSSKK